MQASFTGSPTVKARRFSADVHGVGRRILAIAFASAALSCLSSAILISPSSAAGNATSCRLRSVDQAAYVSQNLRLLRTLPGAPRARIQETSSFGQHAPDACVPHENGPHYAAFITIRTYKTLSAATAKAAVVWYARQLPSRGWTLISGSTATESLTYHRGFASLAVQAFVGSPNFTISVDYLLAKPR